MVITYFLFLYVITDISILSIRIANKVILYCINIEHTAVTVIMITTIF